MAVRWDMVDKKYRKFPGRVMFPSSHDITDDPEIKEACFTVLRKLLDSGNEVLVTLKPRFGVVEEMVRTFDTYADQIQFRFTITSRRNSLLRFWEPNAPCYEERYRSLRHAYRKGFKTSVSIEPFLDYDPGPLIHALAPYASESIWLGIMNYIRKNRVDPCHEVFYERIRANYTPAHIWDIHLDLGSMPKVRLKDSLVNRLRLASAPLSAQPAMAEVS